MLFVGAQTVFDDLAIGAVLFQLRSAVGKRRGAPEIGVHGLALADHLVLLEQLGEQDIECADEHDQQDEEGDLRHDAAFAERGDEAVGILAFFLHAHRCGPQAHRSEEHTSELQSLMRISYAVFRLKKKNNNPTMYTATT